MTADGRKTSGHPGGSPGGRRAVPPGRIKTITRLSLERTRECLHRVGGGIPDIPVVPSKSLQASEACCVNVCLSGYLSLRTRAASWYRQG